MCYFLPSICTLISSPPLYPSSKAEDSRDGASQHTEVMLCAQEPTAIGPKTRSWPRLLLKVGHVDTVKQPRWVLPRRTLLHETLAITTVIGLALPLPHPLPHPSLPPSSKPSYAPVHPPPRPYLGSVSRQRLAAPKCLSYSAPFASGGLVQASQLAFGRLLLVPSWWEELVCVI